MLSSLLPSLWDIVLATSFSLSHAMAGTGLITLVVKVEVLLKRGAGEEEYGTHKLQ